MNTPDSVPPTRRSGLPRQLRNVIIFCAIVELLFLAGSGLLVYFRG